MELEEFKRHLELIQKAYDKETEIMELFDCEGNICHTDDLADTIVDLLTDYFEDEDDWINYWLWELEFGTKWKPGYVQIEGQDVKLQTIEDLYNILMER
jgi:hypothetical protein